MDNQLRLWDIEANKLVKTIEPGSGQSQVFVRFMFIIAMIIAMLSRCSWSWLIWGTGNNWPVCFSCDGRFIVTGGKNGEVRMHRLSPPWTLSLLIDLDL